MDEFNWVISVLNSVNSRNQLISARNLYSCWENKYRSFRVYDLYNKFEEEFLNKEESLFSNL